MPEEEHGEERRRYHDADRDASKAPPRQKRVLPRPLPRFPVQRGVQRCHDKIQRVHRHKIRAAHHGAREKRPRGNIRRAPTVRRTGKHPRERERIERDGVVAIAHHVKRREEHIYNASRDGEPTEAPQPQIDNECGKRMDDGIRIARGEHYAVVRAVEVPVGRDKRQSKERRKLREMPFVPKKLIPEGEAVRHGEIKRLVTAAEAVWTFPQHEREREHEERRKSKALL